MSAMGEQLAAPLSLSSGSSTVEQNRGGQSCASQRPCDARFGNNLGRWAEKRAKTVEAKGVPCSNYLLILTVLIPSKQTGSGTSLPRTPPSVTKPLAAATGKAVVLSNVKRALQYEDPSPRGTSQTVLELAPKPGLLLVRDANTMIASRSLALADSEKMLVVPTDNLAPASQSDPDIVSDELLLPVADDLANPPDVAVVPTPEKPTGSKRRPLAQKADGPGKKKK